MLPVFFASIAFGPPGPVLHKTFADAVVRAEITYRIAHDRYYDTGPAALSPSISMGTLTFTAMGRRRTYDLATVLPIRKHRILLPDTPDVGCGATEPLSRRGGYLIIESVYGEKGCRANATFVDVSSGLIADEIGIDWTWDHRFDALPARFTGQTESVSRVDRIGLRQMQFDPADNGKHAYAPWNFVVVHWTNSSGRPGLAAFESSPSHIDGSSDPGQSVLPRIGDRIRVGYLVDPNTALAERQAVIRLGLEANRLYASLQAPVHSNRERVRRRNNWLEIAARRANDGDLVGAVNAGEVMLEFEDDPTFRTGETADLNRCRAFIPIARQRNLSAHAVGLAWAACCVPAKN